MLRVNYTSAGAQYRPVQAARNATFPTEPKANIVSE